MFDHVISKRHDCPAPSVKNWRCAQAVSLTNGYSAKLEEAAKALNLPQQKLAAGKHLIKTYCAPSHQTEWQPGDKELMANYCMVDVEAMRSMLPHFRQLTEDEWHEFTLTQLINDRGIPVDLSFVEAGWKLSQKFSESANEKINELTKGLVKNATVRKARDEFIDPRLSRAHRSLITSYSTGRAKLSFSKDNRASLLVQSDLDPKVRRYLELVNEAGTSVLSKYRTMLETEFNGCVHEALRFNGASTGRYTSKGLQIHNMSKDCFSPEEANELISRITSGSDIIDAGISLARLTRSAIYHPDGLYWVDLSGIESRVEPWLADDPNGERLLDIHRQGTDIYQVTAANMFRTRVEEITLDQRNAGKVAVLACGYGGGKDALQKMAKNFGLVFSDGQARSIVKSWRRSNPWAVRLWAALEKAVQNAIRNPGVSYWAGRCEWYCDGEVCLWCKLPSGRLLAYPRPKWERHTWNGETKYGPSYQTTDRPKKGNPPVRRQLHRGILSNNITQAVAADLLRQAIVKAEDAGLDIRFTVHDECVGVGSKADGELLNKIMLEVPEWAEGLPLATSGVSYGKRWGK
jgi:DNA polymerase